MKIIYTRHAKEKLRTEEAKKCKITKSKITNVLRKPISETQLPHGVIRTIGRLDKNYSLCVVYKFEDDIIKVITFFPAEKGRYEN